MPDQTIQCTDCKQSFPFTEKDQQFFKQKNFLPPKRCKSCRAKRKAEKEGRGDGR